MTSTNELNFSSKEKSEKQRPIHIRLQQRNGQKTLTIIEDLAMDLDIENILKVLRRLFNTNGTILEKDSDNPVIQLNGDKRHEVKEFFIKYKICDTPIIIHGV